MPQICVWPMDLLQRERLTHGKSQVLLRVMEAVPSLVGLIMIVQMAIGFTLSIVQL